MSVASSLRAELSVVRSLSLRWYRELFDSVVGVVTLLTIKPVVWYVLFGSLFSGITQLPAFPTTEYRSFILPGIAALMALEYVMIGGQCIVSDLQEGFLHKLWVAPISKLSVVSGRVVVMGSMNAVQTVILLGIARLDGVTFATGIAGAAALVGMSAMFAAAMTALSMTVAYVLRYEFAFSAVASFLVLPVVFVSNAFAPTAVMADWLATVADLNPISVTIAGMRALVLDGWVADDVVPAVVLLVGLVVGSSLIAAVSFRRKIEAESLLGCLECAD